MWNSSATQFQGQFINSSDLLGGGGGGLDTTSTYIIKVQENPIHDSESDTKFILSWSTFPMF